MMEAPALPAEPTPLETGEYLYGLNMEQVEALSRAGQILLSIEEARAAERLPVGSVPQRQGPSVPQIIRQSVKKTEEVMAVRNDLKDQKLLLEDRETKPSRLLVTQAGALALEQEVAVVLGIDPEEVHERRSLPKKQ
jgi:hypothetical protein